MENNFEELIVKIQELVQKRWNSPTKPHKPLLFSELGSELAAIGIDYKSILGDQSIGRFISGQAEHFTIVKHPSQSAKIGIIPQGEIYEYQPTSAENHGTFDQKFERIKTNRRAFYSFINVLSELPSEELDRIDIPISVIVRLLEGKK